jgi:MFS family permease
MLCDLQLSYLEFTLITATSILSQFLTLNSWGRLSDAFGNRLILLITGGIIPLLPAAWIVSTDFWYLIAIQTIAGFTWAGFSLCSANSLFDLVNPEKRITYLAAHNVFAAIGVFLGALLGATLAATIPIAGNTLFNWEYALYYVFLISALGRLTIFLLFIPHIKEVRSKRLPTAHGIVLRATRSPVLAGLVFELAGGQKRSR